MDWTQFSILLATLAGLFLWNRSESSADRRDIMQLIRSIQEEIKDFHGRLCSLEERFKDKK